MTEFEELYALLSSEADPAVAAERIYDAGFRFPIPEMGLDETYIRKATCVALTTLMSIVCQSPQTDDVNREATEALVESGVYRAKPPVGEYSEVMETSTDAEPPVEVDPNALILTLHDRCEQCGAAALTQIDMPDETSWQFCGHHGREHRAKLEEAGGLFRTIEEHWEPLKLHAESV